ncbi:MAG: acylneuraminate cytidylyltransferase family protein [Anaerolineales bacterium]
MSPSRVLALIPARGGSKSLPRKNLHPLQGIPLLAYSIQAACESKRHPRILVSTDDDEIATCAESWGAEVPFRRPMELAQDDTLDLPVFLHALNWLEAEEGYQPDIVVHLRPTSPLRPPDLVDRAVEILEAKADADSVRAVIPAGQNPYKMWRMTPAGTLTPLFDSGISEAFNQPRQALPQAYWQTGHIDVVRLRSLREKRSMTGDVIYPVQLDPRYAIDLDTPQDWERLSSRLEAGFDLPWIRPTRGEEDR